VKVSTPMPLLKVPEHVIEDLTRFISENYRDNLPNSLLIAQAFILKHSDYGRKYGLSEITKVIDDVFFQNIMSRK
jgi:hypothetical protein